MNNLNSVLVEGNLTRDPELSYTGKGTAVARLSVANNRWYKQEEEFQKETSFFDVTVWGRQAEVCEQYLKKGRGVRVVGRLRQDRWQDPEGNPRSKVEIVAEHVEFRPERKNGDEQAEDKADSEADTGAAAEQVRESVPF
jgi:single-strand DNA-binding protein